MGIMINKCIRTRPPLSRHRMQILLFVALYIFYNSIAVHADPTNKAQPKTARPNVLIIMVDQLNLRALGCYRSLLADPFIWGRDTVVETPNLDALARKGILLSNFYTVSPTCTPSRASFLTGMYPPTTGAYSNNKPMLDNVTTLAHILQENGYFTAFLGKWHLYGDASPGWGENQTNTFGFYNVTYQYNRGGASKVFLPNSNNPSSQPVYDMYSFKDYIPSMKSYGQDVANETTYLTDFLVQKTMDVILEQNRTPFAVMLSIPDPHPPYLVRPPYNTLFQHLNFDIPSTMEKTLRNYPEKPPKWAFNNDSQTSQPIQELTRLFKNQNALRQYFGMIKLLDDNLGKLFAFIESHNNNTMIVFTSDHGGLLGEHALQNKGKPYKTSAGVPFILKYPPFIPSGVVVHTPTANIDFVPTLLSLLQISINQTSIHGQDLSREWNLGSSSDRTIYLISPEKDWVAAVDSSYKLVLSTKDVPWLFDLVNDPDEMRNYYKDSLYHNIATKMRQKLLTHIERFAPSHLFDPDKAQNDDVAVD